MGIVGRGLAAGAAGTAALNAVGWLDMAVRGRPASAMPGQVVDAVAEATGRRVPGRGHARRSRRQALGELVGIGIGLSVAVGASAARAGGIRLPGVLGAAATGAAAMATADLSAGALGVTDLRRWSGADWATDAATHLAYGAVTHAVLGLGGPGGSARAAVQLAPSPGLVLRSGLLGVAAGSRSSLGLAGPVLSTPRTSGALAAITGRPGSAVAVLGVVGEGVGDKLPAAPSRLTGPGLPVRLLSGTAGGVALARREQARVALPAAAGLVGSVLGSYGGAIWRARSARRRADWHGAVAEDAVAITLAALACLPGRTPRA